MANVLDPVGRGVVDRLSVPLGGLLLRLVVVSAVVAGMALVVRGEYLLAAALFVPLGIAGYLFATEAGLLR